MTAIYSIQGKLTSPTALPRLLESARESRAVQERLGANAFRMYTVVMGGAFTGQFTFTAEFEDAAAVLGFQDAWDADAGAQKVMANYMTLDSPVAIESSDLLVEIDLGTGAPTRAPSAGMAVILTARQGAMDQAIARLADGASYIRKIGASSARLFAYGIGGAQSNMLVQWNEAANQREIGRIVDTFNDPENAQAMKLRAAVDEADGPFTSYTTVLVKEIAY